MVEFYLVSSKRQIKTQKETEQQNFTVILDIYIKKKKATTETKSGTMSK